MTIRRKLLLWYTGVFAVSGCALMLALYLFAAHQMRRATDKFLFDECKEWIELCRAAAPDLSEMERMMRLELSMKRYFPLMFRLYDSKKQGDVIFVGRPLWKERLPGKLDFNELANGKVYSTCRVGRHGRTLRLLTMRLDSDGYPGLILQGGVYIRRLNNRLEKLRIFFGISVLSAICLALAGGWFLASRSLRPMDDIVLELSRVEAQNLSARLAVSETHDEVESLRRGINEMFDRLENSFEQIHGFTANAAHELRAPLAALRCRLGVALNKARSLEEYQRALADALAETSKLTWLVNDLLLLARMDALSERPRAGKVSIHDLFSELQEVFAVAASEKGLSLDMGCDGSCYVLGDRTLLRRLFGNLINNAIRYTSSGGSVSMKATAGGDECVVRVTDTGIGIAPEMRERIFERFFRVDDSRSRERGGTGIGLSICRSIVELYGGRIAVHSEPGVGSTFEVRLPAVGA